MVDSEGQFQIKSKKLAKQRRIVAKWKIGQLVRCSICAKCKMHTDQWPTSVSHHRQSVTSAYVAAIPQAIHHDQGERHTMERCNTMATRACGKNNDSNDRNVQNSGWIEVMYTHQEE